jgi:hypothetical protein
MPWLKSSVALALFWLAASGAPSAVAAPPVAAPTAPFVAAPNTKVINLALVLLPDARLPRGEDVVAAFGTFAPPPERLAFRGAREHKAKSKGKSAAKAEVLEFELRPYGTAFVALVPAPVPGGEAEEAARFSVSSLGTNWKLPEHRAHLVVGLRDIEGFHVLESLSAFTSLVAAVAQVSGAVGIYWDNAGATHDPKFFVTAARKPGSMPRIMLWTGVSVARDPDGRVSMLSLGMKQLGLADMLVTAPKVSGNGALDTFFELLSYVADKHKVFREGEAVARTEGESLPVRSVPSPLDARKKVWRVDLP